MKPPPFTYHDPRTIPEVLDLLAEKDNARLLSGGQSLMPMLNMRYVLPDDVIDLNRVEGAVRDRGAERSAPDRRHDPPARHRVFR